MSKNKQNKKPMSKEKKELLISIIWMIAGAIFVAAGGIMISLNELAQRIGGIIVLVCGCAIIGICIFNLIKSRRARNKQKAH